MKLRKNRGIVLLIAIITTLLITMFIGSALILSQGGSGRQAHNHDSQVAEMAAESGLQYCVARLADNPNWKGDGIGLIVDQPDGLTIYEDRGNIVGVFESDGRVGQFRVRFNYQDDSGDDTDGFIDPADPQMFIDHQFVSLNNVTHASSAPLFRADGPNNSVTSSSAQAGEVPAGSVTLLVEGRSGAALRGVGGQTPATLNPAVSGPVRKSVIEATYKLAGSPSFDAAAQAGGHLEIGLEHAANEIDAGELVVSAVDSSPPRVRSKSTVTVNKEGDPTLEGRYMSDVSGEILAPNSGADFFGHNVNDVPINEENGDFLRVPWDEVKKATAAGPTLEAGTYVIWDDGSLHYYDMNYSDYATFIQGDPTNPGTTMATNDLPAGLTFDGNGKITVSEDLLITSTTLSDELNIIPRAGAQEEPEGGSGGTFVTQIPNWVGDNSITDTIGLVSYLGGSSDMNEFLTMIAPKVDNFSHGGEQWTWEVNGSFNTPGSRDAMLTALMTGGTQIEVDTSIGGGANLDFLDPVGGGGGSMYTIKDGVFLDWLQSNGNGLPQGLLELSNGGAAPPATKTVADLELHFAPPAGESATISSTGDVRLGMGIFGEGGSITTEGNIRIVGARTDLAANPNGMEGVNLYAKGDIDLFALIPDGDTSQADDFEYADFTLTGLVYTQQNFRAHMGHDSNKINKWGQLTVRGALVAFGGDPDPDLTPLQNPGDNGHGNIQFTGHTMNLQFDPAYLGGLVQSLPASPLDQIFYNRIQ